MENTSVPILNEIDSVEFDIEQFNALDRGEQFDFVLRKMSFIKKNILTEVHS